MTSTIRVELD